ncbi:hypothetical protein K2173_027044 [Erythroxylum novogranatense]|uniref:Major facilitator superfamily (MFS) profile domain-containing protein n=1 Tax=Erythroxylum novogranatense TaxID=1862640 RepID=A0AAV8TXX0_9ROSI|nr:hypothetical protein K2173_027044 [Erythroxylum novogranatense]
MAALNTKWIATAASIWIQCSCGASYTFGIYSSDIGANAGILSGLLYSAVTLDGNRRLGVFRGPWVVHLAGAIQWFIGYFVIWAAVVGLIHRPPVPLMCLLMWLAAHAQTFFNTTNVVSGVHNFGDYGGTIVGIMKGFLGLSGAILIQFYDTVCKGHPSTFLLLLALTPTTVSLVLMSLVRNYDTSTRDDKKHLNAFSSVALIIAAYLTILIILENITSLSLWARTATFTVLLILVASPLGIAIRAQREEYDRFAQALLKGVGPGNNPELPSDEGQAGDFSNDERLPVAQDMNLLQAVSTGNFWLLFIAIFCGLGSGLAAINNVSQIGESLGYTTFEINSLVSLWSIWNFLGRFGAGFVSDIFLHRRGWARPLFMAITLAVMTVGHIIVASGFSKNLYFGSVLVGIAYGSQWSLMPTISSEIFDKSLGSYVCSVRVIGYIYDKTATDEGNKCFGTRCFMMSFMIMGAVAFIGFLVALVLFFRTRRFYETVVIKRLHHS